MSSTNTAVAAILTVTKTTTSTATTSQEQQYLLDKANVLLSLLEEPIIDVWALRVHAITDGGLINDSIRRKVWPKLVGLHERLWEDQPEDGTTTIPSNTHPPLQDKIQLSESYAVTPKRSNVVAVNSSSKNESIITTTTNTINTPNEGNPTINDKQRKKVQDIFRSEVNIRSSSSSKHTHVDYDDTNSISSASASSSVLSEAASTSAMTVRRRNNNLNNHKYNPILASSIDATQIELDVLRCTWHLLTKAQKRSQQQYILTAVSSSSWGNGSSTGINRTPVSTRTTATECSFVSPKGGEFVHPAEQEETPTSTHKSNSNRRKLRKIAKMIQRKQRRLSNLINLTLVQSTSISPSLSLLQQQQKPSSALLRYYQGYHDIACIVLSTIGISTTDARYVPPLSSLYNTNASQISGNPMLHYSPTTTTGFEMATAILYQLSQSHFRDCMRTNFTQLQIVMRLTIFPLIAFFDKEVHEHLIQCDMMEPYFALSWIITWFSHDIRDTELVKRLFDFFIVSHPIMPIYMAIAMICHPLNRQDVLQTEHDFSMVHQTLSQLPRNSSMVGWKYRPGDGYVSDDDDEDDGHNSSDDECGDLDDDLLSLGPMGSQSSVDTEFLQQEAATLKQSNISSGYDRATMKATSSTTAADAYMADAEAVSIVSSSMSSMCAARVPFQELIELAIKYIEQIPPHHLIGLATRYFGRDSIQKELSTSSVHKNNYKETNPIRDDITFLQVPPTWTRSFTAHCDRTLKHHRTRKRRFQSVPSEDSEDATSNVATNLSILDSGIQANFNEPNDVVSMYRIIQSNGDASKLMAVIAAGYGLGDDTTERRLKRRRQCKRFTNAGAALAVLAVAIGIGYYLQRQQQQHHNRSKQGQSTLLVTTGSSSHQLDDATCVNELRDPFSRSIKPTKIIATSTKNTVALSPTIAAVERRESRSDIQECKVRLRYSFEQKCTTEKVPSTSTSTVINSPGKFLLPRNNPVGLLKNTLHIQSIRLAMRDIGAVTTLLYHKAVMKLTVFGNTLHHIGTTATVSPINDNINKSQRLIMNLSGALVRSTGCVQKGAGVFRSRIQIARSKVQILFRDVADRFQHDIVVKKQSVGARAFKFVEVMKSAMIEYGNDMVVDKSSFDVAMSSPVIIILRKQYEPSDLNVISAHIQTTLRRVVIVPATKAIKKLQYPQDALRQHMRIVGDSLLKMKQSKTYGTVSEALIFVRRTIAFHVPLLMSTLRKAALLPVDHYTHQKTDPKVLSEASPNHISYVDIDDHNEHHMMTSHAPPADDQCLSDLTLSKRKKLNFGFMNA
jgi:Rab-GTPase-TBC domain